MDREGYRQLLQTRGLSQEQIEQSIAIVEGFEAYLGGRQPASSLERASAEEALAYVSLLTFEGRNSFLELAAVGRYGYLCKNYPVYVAILELLDGSEALEGMHRRVGDELGEAGQRAIFAGITMPPLGLPNSEKASLTRTVMQRLEACAGEQALDAIFAGSFRDLQEVYYLDDKQRYADIGDFDTFLETKRQEFIAELEQIKAEGKLYFSQEITDDVIELVRTDPEISQGVRQGNILYVTKIPYMAKEYLKETDVDRKRYYYCHCPWARESLLQGEGPVSATFCRCSAGFHKKPWEVIFEQKLEADVLESVLQGDLRCRFAIYLPESVGTGKF